MRSTEADFRRHVELLASAAGGPRTPGSAAHDWTQKYIRGCLASFGLRPWVQDNGPYGQNIVAEAGLEDGPLFVIGAHYDSVPGSPGADDNASAVAALLELAEEVKVPANCPYRIQFVAYDREEDGLLGSQAHCKRLKKEGADVRGMISLEMLGFTATAQTLVPGVNVESTRGDFLAIVANPESASLLDLFRKRKIGHLPMEAIIVPDGTEAATLARLSDHGSFWMNGWKALLVTDTAFLRNPHYHQPTDTPDTLDYTFLRRSTEQVAAALEGIVEARDR